MDLNICIHPVDVKRTSRRKSPRPAGKIAITVEKKRCGFIRIESMERGLADPQETAAPFWKNDIRVVPRIKYTAQSTCQISPVT